MAKKKKASGLPAFSAMAEVTPQPITETIETNYMPYVMSVIVSRAIPEIDGFKPAHRKLLYTMYRMGLLTGPRQKSANVVGQTMRLNPHGDASIYETLVRLTRGHDALLHPFIDSKGSFGKQYSRDMAYAASRYTEVRLDPICNELFSGIEKGSVELVPNYDNTTTEPTLLPTTFPNILVSPNLGIAVGMACSICSFNLAEVCDGAIALLKNPNVTLDRILDLIKAPDFSGGGILIYDREKMRDIYASGVGSIRLRARYRYDKEENSIDILQIPYSTSIEAIIKKITDLIKEGKLREITDIRDAIDLSGFRLTIDLRRGTDPERLMEKLYCLTPLEDTFDCNFNILVNGSPRQLGVLDILKEWVAFRVDCIRRELRYDLTKKQDKLHLLLGLGSILLDIDKAIRIIRNTEDEKMVVPNLMNAFSLSEKQAEYIADIKLRHLNREYIRNRVEEIAGLEKEIAELDEIIRDDIKIRARIASDLQAIKKRYPSARRTQIVSSDEIGETDRSLLVDDYPVRLLMTKQGYFKKLSLQAARTEEQKTKDGDEIVLTLDGSNADSIIFLTDRARLYTARLSDFETSRPSLLGEYLCAKLSMEKSELPIAMARLPANTEDTDAVVAFADGSVVKYSLDDIRAHTRRMKLLPAVKLAPMPVSIATVSQKAPDLIFTTSDERYATVSAALIERSDASHLNVIDVLQLKRGVSLLSALSDPPEGISDPELYRRRTLPALALSRKQ